MCVCVCVCVCVRVRVHVWVCVCVCAQLCPHAQRCVYLNMSSPSTVLFKSCALYSLAMLSCITIQRTVSQLEYVSSPKTSERSDAILRVFHRGCGFVSLGAKLFLRSMKKVR